MTEDLPSDVTAATIERAAELLSVTDQAAVSPATLRSDVTAGAPTNADGTLDLVRYAAWLLRAATAGEKSVGD